MDKEFQKKMNDILTKGNYAESCSCGKSATRKSLGPKGYVFRCENCFEKMKQDVHSFLQKYR